MSASSKVHSNAFNFLSHVQSGVDPRTGLYTVSLSLPELECNQLSGPSLPLTLSFSPMSVLDVGFGLGWNINLTEFNPQTSMLSLGTGETFEVEGSGDRPDIPEKKLDSFHFHQDGSGLYRVVHKGGNVEVLQVGGTGALRRAVPRQVLNVDGRALTLGYATFKTGERLESISDAGGELLRIIRDENQAVELQFHPRRGPDNEPLARFRLQLDADARVTRVVLPVDDADWRFVYETINEVVSVREVWTPTGAHETLDYDADGHGFPGGAHPPLPRVQVHRVDPGPGQPVMETRYAYSRENFLGLGALDQWVEGGRDNLYNVADPTFRYTTTTTQWSDSKPLRSVQRSFNRFHLMVDEVALQDRHRKAVTTTYYADLPENRNLPFALQPAQCQLPYSVETRWDRTDELDSARSETVQTRFDSSGNLTEQHNADGTCELVDYYPVEGVPGACPRDPEEFVRNPRWREEHPAASAHGSAPVLRTEYTYLQIEALPGQHNKPFLREHLQLLKQTGSGSGEGELTRTENDYFDDPHDDLRLGRLKSATETRNGKPTVTDYQYRVHDSAGLDDTVLETIETVTGFDGTHLSLTQQHSLLNGQPLLVEDLKGVKIAYAYDALQRVVRETVAPETEYEASRLYTYYLLGERSGSTERAWQSMTDVKGVQTRTFFDGSARVVEEERQDADTACESGQDPREAPFRTTLRIQYNDLGQEHMETVIDWLGEIDLPLTRTFSYDAWGERLRTLRPDGVTEVNEFNPCRVADAPGPVRRQWLESTTGTRSAVTETWLDLFGEPVRVERVDTGNTRVSLVEQHRDGRGRLVEEIDAREALTAFTYDAFDRVLTTTLPGGAVVTRSYAAHSTDDLPESIDVDGTVLGTQTFDGLDRLVEAVTGGRKRTLEYEDGMSQPERVVTPAGEELTYVYQPHLGEALTQRVLKGSNTIFLHDRFDASLTACVSDDVELERQYYSNGELKSETRRQGGYTDLCCYAYSLQGRLLSSTVVGATQEQTHDAAGRVKTTWSGSTHVTFEYDRFGRPWKILTHDSADGTQLDMTVEYDDVGREKLRTFNVAGVERTLTRDYDGNDALTGQVLSEAGQVVRAEGYRYDTRGRLILHTCEGSELPQDAYGNPFTSQVFQHDALDNITLLITTTVDQGTVRATYHFEGTDPVQLSRITHQGSPGYPGEIRLHYDDDGNLLQDEQGRQLSYDALGRLTHVEGVEEEAALVYRYDGLDVLAGAESDGVRERRFHVEDRLVARQVGEQRTSWLRAGDLPLAERTTQGSSTHTRLLAVDIKNTVLGELDTAGTRHRAYTAYGHSGEDPPDAEIGYNGQSHEPQTRWQLLGNGYRSFNPSLQRFHSPDSLSPFQAGVNSYAYCAGNPINRIDPTGHLPALFWAGVVLAAAGIVGTVAGPNDAVRAIAGVAAVAGMLTAASTGMKHYRNLRTEREKNRKATQKTQPTRTAPAVEEKSIAQGAGAGNQRAASATSYLDDVPSKAVTKRNPIYQTESHAPTSNKTRPSILGSALFSKRLQSAPLPPAPQPPVSPVVSTVHNARTPASPSHRIRNDTGPVYATPGNAPTNRDI